MQTRAAISPPDSSQPALGSIQGESHGTSPEKQIASPAQPPDIPCSPSKEYDGSSYTALTDIDTSYLPQQHLDQRRRTVASLQPLQASARPYSPVRGHARNLSVDMPFTGDERPGRRPANPSGRFAGWFGGNGIGFQDSIGAQSATSSRGGSPEANPTRGLAKLSISAASNAQARFGMLTSSVSSAITRLKAPTPISPTLDDELLSLNVEATLFPTGSPTEQDTFSPAAYKNLQANAIGILTKMQNAYRQRTYELHDIQSERSAQKDELDETAARVQILKIQLQDMATKAAEQTKLIEQMKHELAIERKAANEARLTRDKNAKTVSEASAVSEDLGVDDVQQRKSWRKSEQSFDTDEDSVENDSVFSRSRSPTIVATGPDGGNPEPISLGPSKSGDLLHQRPKPQHQMSAFQKIVKGITGEVKEGDQRCRNCEGQSVSYAWDTVSLLRDENRGLKSRVTDLEHLVEGALDVINGVGR